MAEYGVGFNGEFTVNADSEEEAEIKVREKLMFLDDVHIGYIVNMDEDDDDEEEDE